MISNYICTFGLTEGKKSESDVREITSQRECDTPGVYFGVCRKNYPNLGCSVKISISRSRMCLIIQISHSHFTEFEIIQSHRRPNLEPVKTFNSRN
jgi:hypothetical protein